VTGLIVPVILLPLDAETWSAERRRIVLAHELAHVASRDCLASVIAQLAVAIHWFDPLVWLAARRLRIERELAADDQVIAKGVLASSYAEHLLALATSDRPMPAGALAMAEPSQVSVRIRALLTTRTRTPLGRARFALLAAGVTLAALVACATPERDREPAPAPPAETTSPTPSQPSGSSRNDRSGDPSDRR
jgi:beta-lactamase regulating signal transducer with metallopeptidase domain